MNGSAADVVRVLSDDEKRGRSEAFLTAANVAVVFHQLALANRFMELAKAEGRTIGIQPGAYDAPRDPVLEEYRRQQIEAMELK